MGKDWNKKYWSFGFVITISVCICIVFAQLVKGWRTIAGIFGMLMSALTPFIIGLVLAFLLNPIMVYFRKGMTGFVSKHSSKHSYEQIYKKSKVPALILTLVLFAAVLTGFLWLVIPKIYLSLTDLVNNAPGYFEKARDFIEATFAKNEMLEGRFSSIVEYVENNIYNIFRDKVMPNLDTIALKISNGVIVGLKALLDIFVGLIVTIYLLASKETLLAQAKKIIYWLFPKKTGNKILEGCSYANMVFGGFINGKIIDSIIIGILCFIFTAAVNMKYAVLISVIVGVTNVIPFFGPFIGAVPSAFLALMDDPIYLLIFIVWIIILQQFDGNILGPLILGDSTGLSGIWVLVAIIVGGDMFGVPGMILGVPVFACMYAFVAVQLRDGLRKKNLSSSTEDYVRLAGFDEESGEPIYRSIHEEKKKLKGGKSFFKKSKTEKNKAKDKESTEN